MFEIGFTELLLISALALIVLGPERLPRVASQLGRWVGRARAMARQFREQLDMEAQLDSLSRPTPLPPPAQLPAPTPPETNEFPPAPLSAATAETNEIPSAPDIYVPADPEPAEPSTEPTHERGA